MSHQQSQESLAQSEYLSEIARLKARKEALFNNFGSA